MPSIEFIHVDHNGAKQMSNPFATPAGSQTQADGLSDQALIEEARRLYRNGPIVWALIERFEANCRTAEADRRAINAIYDKAYAEVDEGLEAEALNEVLHAIIDLIPPEA
jgi:hypothetical protein